MLIFEIDHSYTRSLLYKINKHLNCAILRHENERDLYQKGKIIKYL